jgi:hypothetical protein
MMWDNTFKVFKKLWNSRSSWTDTAAIIISFIVLLFIGAVIVVGAILGAYWVVWQLWIMVMVEIAQSMPPGFREPKYEVFMAVHVLALFVRNYISGFFSKKELEY